MSLSLSPRHHKGVIINHVMIKQLNFKTRCWEEEDEEEEETEDEEEEEEEDEEEG